MNDFTPTWDAAFLVRFLVDECTGPGVARWLRELGYDAVSVFDEARGIDDAEVLAWAFRERRVLISNDKDFGDRVFRDAREHCGVLLLRLADERTPAKIAAIERALSTVGEALVGSFVVVSDRAIRISQAIAPPP